MMTDNSAEISYDAALSALRREYYSDVRDYAKEIVQAVKDGEIEDRDSLYTRVHETCDGCQWVIYTQKAQIVLIVSDNDGRYIEEYGSEGAVSDGILNWSALAYAAMEGDLFEQLEAEGLDVNGETPEEMLGDIAEEAESDD